MVPAVFEHVQFGRRGLLKPQVGPVDWRVLGVTSPGKPQWGSEARNGLRNAVIEVAAQIGRQGRMGTRLMAGSIVVVEPCGIDLLRRLEDLSAQVLAEGRSAGEQVEARFAEDGKAQQSMKQSVLHVGFVAMTLDTRRHHEAQMADQFRVIYCDLNGVGRRQPCGDEYAALCDDTLQEVDQEPNVQFPVIGDRWFVGPAPAQEVGSVDPEAPSQVLAGWPPLFRVVPGAETVEKDERGAQTKALKGDLTVLPGESLLAPPGGVTQSFAVSSDQGVGESWQAHSRTAEKETLDESLAAARTPFCIGALVSHDR